MLNRKWIVVEQEVKMAEGTAVDVRAKTYTQTHTHTQTYMAHIHKHTHTHTHMHTHTHKHTVDTHTILQDSHPINYGLMFV